MTKLTKQEAYVLVLEESSSGGEEVLPSCLEDLTRKQFVFQIRDISFNFTSNHHIFTASTLSEDDTIENHGTRKEEHSSWQWKRRMNGNFVFGAVCFGLRVGEEFSVEDPPEIPADHNNRKWSRE